MSLFYIKSAELQQNIISSVEHCGAVVRAFGFEIERLYAQAMVQSSQCWILEQESSSTLSMPRGPSQTDTTPSPQPTHHHHTRMTEKWILVCRKTGKVNLTRWCSKIKDSRSSLAISFGFDFTFTLLIYCKKTFLFVFSSDVCINKTYRVFLQPEGVPREEPLSIVVDPSEYITTRDSSTRSVKEFSNSIIHHSE